VEDVEKKERGTILEQRVSRKRFIQLTAGLGVAAAGIATFAAQCSGGTPTATTAPAPAPTATSAAPAPTATIAPAPAPTATTMAASKQTSIGLCVDDRGVVVSAYQYDTIRKEFQKNYPNVKLIELDGQGKLAKQVSDMEGLINMKVDGIICKPKEAAGLTAVVAKAVDAGIPVVLLDPGVQGEGFGSWAKYSGADIGSFMAEKINQDFDGTAEIVYVSGQPGAISVTECDQAFHTGLKKHPGVDLLAEQWAEFNADRGALLMQALLQANPYIDACFSWSDVATKGVLQAIDAAGRTEIRVYSALGLTEALGWIRDGRIAGTLRLSLGEHDAANLVMKILRGEQVPKILTTTQEWIDQSTLDQWDVEGQSYLAEKISA
jgi:ribose transport system substrate-binding protein